MSNTTSATSVAKTTYPSGAPDSSPSFSGVLLFYVRCFVDHYLSFRYLFFPMYCLYLFGIFKLFWHNKILEQKNSLNKTLK